MRGAVFVDTWGWLALMDKRDADHDLAVATYRELRQARLGLVTTNLVIYETVENLRRRLGASRAVTAREVITNITAEPQVLDIVRPGVSDEADACVHLIRFADQDLSLTDAFSFAVMRRLGLTTAFTGDRHFTLLGFETTPALKR